MQVSASVAPVRPKAKSGRPPAANALLLVITLMTGIGMFFSSVPILLAGCGLCLILVVLLLWTEADPPILLLPVLFQWSEVAILPYSTSWLQLPLNALSENGADLNASAILGLIGVFSLAVGMRLGARQGRVGDAWFSERIEVQARLWTQNKIIVVSFSLIGIGYALALASAYAGGLREPLNQAAGIKNVGLFIFTYWSLYHGRSLGLLVLLVVFEVGFGMTGFFANFKNSVLTFFVAALFARPRIRMVDTLSVLGAGILIVALGVFWSAIKPDYRDFMNKGTGAQIVDVPITARIDFLVNSASSMNSEKIAEGFQRLVSRHGYIEYLALVMQNIPQTMSYQNGEITLSVLRHVAVPRALWKAKPVLPNDTEVMSKYTGLPMVWNEDTSISIGYLGELYADFGYIGGVIGCLIIGLLVGTGYRLVRDQVKMSALVAAGLCLMLALPIAYFGTAYVKLAGSFVLTFFIVLVLSYSVFPALFPSGGQVDTSQNHRTGLMRRFHRI